MGTLQGWLKAINPSVTSRTGGNCPPNAAPFDLVLTNRAEQRPEGSIPPLLYKAQGSITFTHVNSPFSAFESLTEDNFETVLGEAGSGTCNADPNATDLYDEDGTTGIARKVFARDAYKLNLHYYDGDYSPINMPGYTAASGLANSERHDLYNGNISSMAVNIRKLATVANSPGAAYAGAMLYNYRYDQLNRLMEVDAHATNGSFGLGSALPHTPLPDYKERYSYDPNGNIKTLFRNGTSGTYAGHATPNVAMDDLTYKYQYATSTPGVMGEYTPGQADPTDLGHYTNRLASVQDPANLTGNYTDDIDNQAALNYTYDAIGNLIHDEKGDIDIIDWTVYGKIERIVKKDGSKIEYTYDASGNRISKAVIPPTGGGGAITWYVRDAQGNVMSTYVAGDNSLNNGALTQTELHVYGSSRIGVLNLSLNCSGSGLSMASTRTLTRGQKFFELTNHLGNVLATVTDRLVPIPDANSTMVDYYLADVASATDYYAFGMQMPGRSYSSGAYRYGFNGQEMSNEIKGVGNSYTAEFWEYDPRLGRRWNGDPVRTASMSPFMVFDNNPIRNADPLGNTWVDKVKAKIWSHTHGGSGRVEKSKDGKNWLAYGQPDEGGISIKRFKDHHVKLNFEFKGESSLGLQTGYNFNWGPLRGKIDINLLSWTLFQATKTVQYDLTNNTSSSQSNFSAPTFDFSGDGTLMKHGIGIELYGGKENLTLLGYKVEYSYRQYSGYYGPRTISGTEYLEHKVYFGDRSNPLFGDGKQGYRNGGAMPNTPFQANPRIKTSVEISTKGASIQSNINFNFILKIDGNLKLGVVYE